MSRLPFLPLALLMSCATAFGAGPLARVAYDDAGSDASEHLLIGEPWVFQAPGIADALQSVAFGDRVTFGYDGLDVKASYRVRLAFFVDGDRTLAVSAGGKALGEVKLAKGETKNVEFDVPAAAFDKGRLIVAIDRVAGDNAVVSEIELLSDSKAPVRPLPASVKDADLFVLEKLPVLVPEPAAVTGCRTVSVDLGGKWKFHPAPPAGFEKGATSGWRDIAVPGEWSMQGFEVGANVAAGYSRTFAVPEDWKGKRVLLAFDGVFSDAVVYVNGREAARHLGGFTPFQADVTSLLSSGVNTLTLAVRGDSEADTLASASSYACHPLGGIPRAVRMFALPEAAITSMRVATTFDKAYRDAVLTVDLESVAASGTAGLDAEITLLAPDGKPVALANRILSLASGSGTFTAPVAAPAKWDPAHPNLHTLEIRLKRGGETLSVIRKKIGFRSVVVDGDRMLVNGVPVKMRGVNHHEVHPLGGRSVPAGFDRRDVELFREANVNLLRTCHYPPTRELVEAADELGMFIECEAPFCWAPGKGHDEAVSRQTAEMVLNFRNNPSVLFWSLANESQWGSHFAASSNLVRKLDPTRPQTFNWMSGGIQLSEAKYVELANIHYPGHGGPAQARKYGKRPVYLGEDSHLNAYNRLELATDPSLRDLWGKYVRGLWDDLYATRGVLGQSVWSGIDDTFYMSGDRTRGYGTWGPIDGWRRTKPEYWNLKKIYSPVRLLETAPAAVSQVQRLKFGNRSDAVNLREFAVTWTLGADSGKIAAPDVAPGADGVLEFTLPRKPEAREKLRVTFTDPRGFVADDFLIGFAGAPVPALAPAATGYQSVSESPATLTIVDGSARWVIDRKAGAIVSAAGKPFSGPSLMLLPLNDAGETRMETGTTKVWAPFTAACADWKCSEVTMKRGAGSVVVVIKGRYANAEGAYTITFHEGVADVGYDFGVTAPVNPRQTGVVFTLPREAKRLSWLRKGYWDSYPADHIARLEGSVSADEGFPATSVGPRTQPSHPWRLDNLPYGNNDFCSTKHNVYLASLLDPAGHGIVIDGRGETHARAWRTEKESFLLAANYSNGGSERFLGGLTGPDRRPLPRGAHVTGTVRISVK